MNIFLYLITVFIWGSTWFAITFQLGQVSTDVSIFYRFIVAIGLVLGWCYFRKINLRFPIKHHLLFAGQGLFMFSLNYLAAYEATNYIPSGLNAIGFSMVLVFNIINSAIFYRIPLTLPVLAGATCGMVGITIIFWPSLSTLDFTSDSLLGICLSLLAGLFASLGQMVAVKERQENLPVNESNVFGMIYGSLVILMFILFNGSSFEFEGSFSYIISLLYLSVFGTIVAFWCYLTLLGRIGASKASYALVITPVVALALSALFEGLILDFNTLFGVGLILAGNVIILMKKSTEAVSHKTA